MKSLGLGSGCSQFLRDCFLELPFSCGEGKLPDPQCSLWRYALGSANRVDARATDSSGLLFYPSSAPSAAVLCWVEPQKGGGVLVLSIVGATDECSWLQAHVPEEHGRGCNGPCS